MHKSFIAAALALSVSSLAASSVFAAQAAPKSPTISLRFDGVATPSGNIMIALFDVAGWDSGKPVRVAMIDASGANLTTVFSGLAPGQYAIKSFHDINGDGKMNTNPFGMPTEPFAFSNNAHGEKGPPSWDAAAFDVSAAGATQIIIIR